MIDDVIEFWFGTEPEPTEETMRRWFVRDEAFDAEIRTRFGALHAQAAAGGLTDWLATPRGTLALVIVLDQFSRNMFRDSPRSFATDPLALSIAERAIAAGFDQQLDRQQRWFLYMPFQHSEDRAVQARSIELFAQLGDAGSLDYAHRHKEVIDRFGRFPHRNAVLGRDSTPEELQFLATHRGF